MTLLFVNTKKILSKEKLMLKGFSISLLLSEVQAKSFDWTQNIQVPVIKEPDTLDAEPMNV